MNSTPSVPDLRQIMRDHRGLFLAEGIVFLLLGALAIMLPLIASGILAYFIGWMALVVGILLFVRGFGLPGSEDRGTVVLTGGLFVVLGLLVVLWPWAALEGLTLCMAFFCILRGVMDVSGIPHRSSSTAGLQVVSGVAGLLLGGLLLLWYPEDAEWAPGLLFGIQLLFMGFGALAVWNALDHPEAGGAPS
ncbi:MAG: DUF308 domain-containing protein [Planctomycetota bacterium]|nr:DUF308 domain-containing protein [Planctomycetota bacterium]